MRFLQSFTFNLAVRAGEAWFVRLMPFVRKNFLVPHDGSD
jgi:hypothetical protein